ncbi:hypothetical protein BH23ACT5_BH23ACT5_10330 [soil metagenome]
MAGITLDDVDLYRWGTILVTGKGNRKRVLKVGPRTSKALDRHLRVRARHGDGETRWLWLGKKGRLLGSGIAQMLRRRSDQAEIEAVHPHQFRHTFSHNWLAAGGGEQDLMLLTGWKSRECWPAMAPRRRPTGHETLTSSSRPSSDCSDDESGTQDPPQSLTSCLAVGSDPR